MAMTAEDPKVADQEEEAPVHILWINAGLSCDGDSVALTSATQPSIEEIVLGALPGLPKIAVHWPLIDFECGPMQGADTFIEWFYKADRGELEPFVLVIEGSIPPVGSTNILVCLGPFMQWPASTRGDGLGKFIRMGGLPRRQDACSEANGAPSEPGARLTLRPCPMPRLRSSSSPMTTPGRPSSKPSASFLKRPWRDGSAAA
jgi:hypothetical protein